jgi:hypothetical protein
MLVITKEFLFSVSGFGSEIGSEIGAEIPIVPSLPMPLFPSDLTSWPGGASCDGPSFPDDRNMMLGPPQKK